jgi:TonB-dependent receptor
VTAQEVEALAQTDAHLFLDRVLGDAQPLGDLPVRQGMDPAEYQNFAAALGEGSERLAQQGDLLLTTGDVGGIGIIKVDGGVGVLRQTFRRVFCVTAEGVEGGVARDGEEESAFAPDVSGSFGPPEPEVGFLNEILDVGQPGETPTQVAPEPGVRFAGKRLRRGVAVGRGDGQGGGHSVGSVGDHVGGDPSFSAGQAETIMQTGTVHLLENKKNRLLGVDGWRDFRCEWPLSPSSCHPNPITMNAESLVRSLRRFLGAFVALPLFLLAARSAEPSAADTARDGVGTLTGVVVASESRAPLEFVSVSIDGTPLKATTRRDGSFTLANAPSGAGVVRVTYAGREEKTVEFTLAPGGSQTLDVSLELPEVITLGTFEVRGERSGSAAAMQQQRQSVNAVSVITADQFGGVADGRIDDALKRIPGVGFQTGTFSIRGVPDAQNSITVNGSRLASATFGDTRAVATDRIPGDRVERIEVNKTLLPNMEADAVGGTINLVPKSAFDRSERELSTSFGVSIIRGLENDPETGYFGSFAYGDVFSIRGGTRNLGVNLSLSYSDKPAVVDLPFEGNELINVFSRNNIALDTATPSTSFPRNVRRRARAETNERTNVGLGLDYKLGEGSSLSLNVYRNERVLETSTKNTRIQIQQQNIIPLDAAGNPTNAATIGVLAGFDSLGVTKWRNARSGLDEAYNYNTADSHFVQIGGRHDTAPVRLSWNVAYSSDDVVDEFHEMVMIGDNATHVTIDRTGDPLRPRIIYTGGKTPVSIDLTSINSATNEYILTDRTDEIASGRFDLEKDLASRVPVTVKGGLAFRRQERKFDPRRSIFATWSVANAGRDFSRYAATPINPFGLYDHERFSVDTRKATADVLAGSNAWTFNPDSSTRGALANDGSISEEIVAGYTMAQARVNRMQFVGGVRYERTKVSGDGYLFQGAQAGVPVASQYSRVSTKGDYDNAFPSGFVEYEVRDGVKLRASYSNGIGRPAFASLRPTTTINNTVQNSGAPGRITQANPALKPQYTDNFDLALEYYFKSSGLFSVAAFRKEIEDFQQSVTLILPAGGGGFGSQYAGYELVTSSNRGDATVEGYELSYQQQFTSLPGLLSGLGGFANWTHLKATGSVPGGGVTAIGALQNYIPDTVNLGLTYQRYPFSLRVLGFWRSGYFVTVNADPSQSLYRRKLFDMDIKAEYRLSERFRLFCDVYNVLRSEPVNAEGTNEDLYLLRPATIYRRPVQIEAGVRASW